MSEQNVENRIRDQVTTNDVVLFMKREQRFSPVWILRPRDTDSELYWR